MVRLRHRAPCPRYPSARERPVSAPARASGSAVAAPGPEAAYDVVVIGGGGHGLATAYYLASGTGSRTSPCRARLAGRREHGPQHRDHPQQLPVGRERGDLRARAPALGDAGDGARLRPAPEPARRPQPRAQPARRARGPAPRPRQSPQRRRCRLADARRRRAPLPDRQRLARRRATRSSAPPTRRGAGSRSTTTSRGPTPGRPTSSVSTSSRAPR